ncbi:FadR/GntR family transcriptional regulator [Mesorhizobium sp. ASY16-5R]|uniref:FadR/GntR family transcriptional regulator n=1 Tax=Mesorhizobium sp. ASY16-5R TaxID=3445772 RepID=UPI003FA01324
MRDSENLTEATVFQDPGALVRNVHGQIAERIGLSIVRGDIAPGDPLPSEVRLCEMMGVSRTVIREAVRGLVAKGLVDSKPKRGTRVRDPAHWNHLDPDVLRWRVDVTDTETYLKKMFQLRRATEPEACALAASEANAEDHVRLSRDFQAMVDAGADNAAWVEADLAFHRSIYLATHNEFFWPIGQLFSFGLRQMFAIAAQGSHRPRAVVEHRDVLDAILARKPDLARAAALTLLGNATSDIDRIRQALASAQS